MMRGPRARPWATLMRRLSLTATVACVVASCAGPDVLRPLRAVGRDLLPRRPTPTATVEPPTAGPLEGDRVIMVLASVEGQQPLAAGSTARIVVRVSPWLRKVSGAAVTWEQLAGHPAASMRLCLVREGGCPPDAGWQPWTGETSLPLAVDWLGAQRLYVVAEFRDRDGRPVAASDGYADPAAQARNALDLCSALDERTPLAAQPAPIQTAAAGQRAAFPVSGSVLIEQGRPAAGGMAGDTIAIEVDYAASSPVAPVTEMRVTGQLGACAAMPADVPWAPFVAHRSYKVTLALNWVGYYRCVQFRDAAGNLSPVYCDDISLEGNPPPPSQ